MSSGPKSFRQESSIPPPAAVTRPRRHQFRDVRRVARDAPMVGVTRPAGLVDLREHPGPHVVGRERRADGGRRQVAQAGLVEVQQVGRDGVLLVEGGAEHRRVVGVDGDRHPGLDEPAQRVLRERGDGARRDVRRRADLQADPGLGQVREQGRVLGGRGAVADPLGAEQAQRLPDRLRPGRLARVRHAVQTGRAGRVEVRLELRPRHADLRPAEAEPDQRVDAVLEGVLQRGVGRRQAALPRDVVDPAQHEPEVPLRRDPRVLDRLGVGLDRDAAQRPRCTACTSARRTAPADPRPSRGRPRRSGTGCRRPCGSGRRPRGTPRRSARSRGRRRSRAAVGVARHHARVTLGELADDPGRRRADVVHVQLGLRQAAR